MLEEFYRRLKDIKDYHRRNPNELVESLDRELHTLRQVDALELETIFSGEEGFGKYLDLHSLFERFINLKGIEKVDYVTYLDEFYRLHLLLKDLKSNSEYKRYGIRNVIFKNYHFLAISWNFGDILKVS